MSAAAPTMKHVDVAVIGPVRPPLLADLEALFTVHRVWEAADPVAALGPAAAKVRGVVSTGLTGLPAAVIHGLPGLEICAVNGVGLETVDRPLARARGVVVTTTPVLFEDVADLAVLLGMAACRRLVAADAFVRSGAWPGGHFALGRKFSGRRAGILGLGRIGRALAGRLAGFAMPIGYHDPAVAEPALQAFPSAEALAEWAEIFFVCAASPPAAPPLVDAAVLAALGPDGILVNVSRGWLVDEPALVTALAAGRLGAAGLDVFAAEPEVPEALRRSERVVLTPHIASSTEETMGAMGRCVVDNLASWFAGQGALTPVP